MIVEKKVARESRRPWRANNLHRSKGSLERTGCRNCYFQSQQQTLLLSILNRLQRSKTGHPSRLFSSTIR